MRDIAAREAKLNALEQDTKSLDRATKVAMVVGLAAIVVGAVGLLRDPDAAQKVLDGSLLVFGGGMNATVSPARFFILRRNTAMIAANRAALAGMQRK